MRPPGPWRLALVLQGYHGTGGRLAVEEKISPCDSWNHSMTLLRPAWFLRRKGGSTSAVLSSCTVIKPQSTMNTGEAGGCSPPQVPYMETLQPIQKHVCGVNCGTWPSDLSASTRCSSLASSLRTRPATSLTLSGPQPRLLENAATSNHHVLAQEMHQDLFARRETRLSQIICFIDLPM